MPTVEKRNNRTSGSRPAAHTKRRVRQAQSSGPERATLTPLESTKVTGFGIQATYRMLRDGKLPHIKVGMRFYIPKAALARFMETCGGAAA
jgi:excisionase family DNA binding protein